MPSPPSKDPTSRGIDLYVDHRFGGPHGIGRYATEVYARLDRPWLDLPVEGDPTSPMALFGRGWHQPSSSDLIYSPGFGTGRSRARQLLTVHDLIHLQVRAPGLKGAAHRLYYERAVKPAIKRMGHVFTVSETSAAAIDAWLGVEHGVSIHVTNNGCSADFVAEGPKESLSRPFALFVGGSKAHKNAEVALAALARVDDLDLVAITSEADWFADAARRHGLGDRVRTRHGLTDVELASYYRGSVCLLYPSLVEGFGLPVLEALRCDTKVVYSATAASVAEICGGTQFAVDDPHDPRVMAEVLDTCVRSEFKRPDHLERYDWDNVAAVVNGVLSDFL